MIKLGKLKKIFILFIVSYALIIGGIVSTAQNFTAGGETISNFASGSYENETGDIFETVSPVISFVVQAISSIVVTPDEEQASEIVGANEQIVRNFDVCNTSNIADFYILNQATVSSPAEITALYFDVDESGDVSAGDISISLNNTESPNTNPGDCIKILVVINTKNISPNQNLNINIRVRSGRTDTSNGSVEDSGQIINSTGRSAGFTNPNDPSLLPLKLVENRPTYTTGENQPFDYLIHFRNSGEVTARNVVISDELPAELAYVSNTLRFNGKIITDQSGDDEGEFIDNRLILRLQNSVQPGEEVRVTFSALVAGNVTPGRGIVNVANISAGNAPTVSTSQAIVVVDPFGKVYAARGGEGSPIPGARVTIVTDQNLRTPLNIPEGNGFEPNLDNENPYLTDAQGRFAFALRPDQLGSSLVPATYFITVSAEGFRPRLLEINITPSGNGLFRMTVRSLDGMPIAVAGGFELTENNVEISSIADVALNIPMFEESTLEINKTADRNQAEIGDLVNYRVDIANSGIAPISDLVVRDSLPNSFNYVNNSARITRGSFGNESIEPEFADNILQFRIGRLESGERISLVYRVRIGVNARAGDNYNVAVAAGRFNSGEIVQTNNSRALVRIDSGMFSMKQVIIGRVFIDSNSSGFFDEGERPVAGARLYLSNGNSVVTDSQGLYNLPAVSSGSQVIALDPITLPNGYVLSDSRSRSGKDWTRLLRTPLGGGGLLRQNFALTIPSGSPDPIEKQDFIDAKQTVAALIPDEFKAENKVPERIYESIAPGGVVVHSISEGQVILTPGFNLDTSVAENWETQIEINGKNVGADNIGSTRKDPKNKIVTYTFIGLGLKPGPNKLRVTAVSPDGKKGESNEMTVYGRGAAERFKILPERSELQASGRDSTNIIIQAFDQWGNPAQDASITIQTSAGEFVGKQENAEKVESLKEKNSIVAAGIRDSNSIAAEQNEKLNQQQKVELVGGIGVVKLISDNRVGTAKLEVIKGNAKAEADIRFTAEMRPKFLAGLAELTIGSSAPEMTNLNTDENVRSRVQFFYRGSFFGDKNLLTLAYDSQQALNRVDGEDRLFQLNPLDRTYPLFGDSSTQFQETESNSKLYARLDRGRNYALFGDFDADMGERRLLSYGRRLTGVKLHLENENSDFISVTGARPDTSFARQTIPGGTLGLVQLGFSNILIGSEVLSLEVRDRRNPEVIISRENLVRSLDYNIDTSTGTIFFLRPIPTFDRDLNLVQVVATYEYRGDGMESTVYTARANKNFNSIGLRLGFSYINQQQTDESPFQLGGLDASLNLPNRGKLDFDWAMSRGFFNSGFSFFGNNGGGNRRHNGNAFAVSLVQPVNYGQTILRFDGINTSRDFYNPFGATTTPGSTRGEVSVETKPLKNSTVKLKLVGEKNETENVDNNRVTAGIEWSQIINEKLRFNFGYDFRKFSDSNSDRSVGSNLFTIGADIKPIEKLNLSVKREQNFGASDPSFPTQTLISADYQIASDTKIFFTQRFSDSPITPISDVSGTGFASSNSRNETAVGVETQFGKYTSMSGRYQLENGINGTDSFAIVGLQNRLPVSKTVSLELGFERAFHLTGEGESYNNFTLGANFLPSDSFRSSFRYELRDRDGLGQLFSFGAAGEIKPGWTTLGRFQYGNIKFEDRQNRITNGQVALAIRPHNTDKYGLLFSYQHRDSLFSDSSREETLPTKLRSDIISVDGFHQTTRRLELYGRFALKFSGDGNTELPYANNLTYLFQSRANYRLTRFFDVAGEGRYLYQPSSGSLKQWFGVETGFWATPDVRIGGGYNFSKSQEPIGFTDNSVFNKKGFYFVLSTKVSNLFNLFGTSEKGLEHYEDKDTEIRQEKLAKKRAEENNKDK